MLKLFIYSGVLISLNPIFGQIKSCRQIPDTIKCYFEEKYLSSEFAIEKKFESVDSVYASQIPLLADMDGDCIPEIIIVENYDQKILIIDSKTGKSKWKINTPIIDLRPNGLAIADIDYDGIPELIFEVSISEPSNKTGKLVCLRSDGNLVWVSDQNVYPFSQFNEKIGGAPALADFNQDGIPEVYVNNKIFSAQTGIKLADGGRNGIGRESALNFFPDAITIAAQLDDDSTDLELAAGFTIYKVSITNTNGLIGNSMTPINIQVDNEFKDGFSTIADINLDGRMDVLVTTPGLNNEALLYAYFLSNGVTQLISKAYLPGTTHTGTGPGVIGDVNGSDKPSIFLTRFAKLLKYSYNGTSNFQLDWTFTTTDSSGFTSLTMFDFNYDGVQEIVYRDETDLRIINGASFPPNEIAKFRCYSPTGAELPIVGDIDNSGQSKICVSCALKDNWSIGNVYVFGALDSTKEWAPSRDVWNQYNYHVLNINDDLTVPRVQKNNATYKNGKYNNFYVQESLLDSNGMYLKRAASLTGKIKCINYDPINDEYSVIFDIYNLANASFKADSNLPVSFYNGDPATTGSLIDIYYTLKILESGDSLLNLEFKFSASNLTDLFMVINTTRNGSGQFNPGHFSISECDYTDNISRTLELPKIEKLNAAICEGNGYQFYDTLVYDAGVYYHKINSVTGCDSIIYLLEITTTDSLHINQTVITCDTYTWNGQTYTQSGTFTHDTTNRFGCDSITTLDLVIIVSTSSTTFKTACDSFSWNGTRYDKSGTYPYQSINSAGCDSTTTLELTIHTSDIIEIQHETCESYNWNGQTYIQSGMYTFDTINRFGCDSSVSLQLTINSVINTTVTDAACNSYTWNGQTYNQSGSYQYKTINNKGCDSITTLHLTVNKSSNSSSAITACESYTWNGVTYDQSGSYQFQTLNADGCDSIATLQLTIHVSTSSTTSATACNSITWNGNTYTQSGNYQYKTQNAAGCDSTATLNLTINKSDDIKIDDVACNSFEWNGVTYTQSGVYQFKTVNAHGCDSVINLNLNIHKSSKSDIALSTCDSLNFNGQILKANGNYTFTLQNANGCDSVINLNLNIRSEQHNNSISQCDSFRWNVNGQTYNQSGVYLEKYTNSFGCDSIHTLDLKIRKSYDLLQQAKACTQYLWPVNNTILTKSGEYTIPLKTIQGCDSVIRLNLIINPDFKKTDTVITNTPYTWPINQEIYAKSGIYQEDFISSEDCDSIHLLYLVIKKDIGIYYPNVINPNGIDRNTKFTLFDNGHTIASINSLSIYDRWGNLLWEKQHFSANDVSLGWDGTFQGQKVLPGVYAWHAQLALIDGSTITEKGDVTIVR